MVFENVDDGEMSWAARTVGSFTNRSNDMRRFSVVVKKLIRIPTRAGDIRIRELIRVME